MQSPLSQGSAKAKFIQIIKHSEDPREERVQGVNSLSSTTRFRPSIRETKPPRLPINELGKWEIFYLGLAGGRGASSGGRHAPPPPRAPPPLSTRRKTQAAPNTFLCKVPPDSIIRRSRLISKHGLSDEHARLNQTKIQSPAAVARAPEAARKVFSDASETSGGRALGERINALHTALGRWRSSVIKNGINLVSEAWKADKRGPGHKVPGLQSLLGRYAWGLQTHSSGPVNFLLYVDFVM